MIDWAPLEEEKREQIPTEAIAQPAPTPPPLTLVSSHERRRIPEPDPEVMQAIDTTLQGIPAETLARLTEPLPQVRVNLEQIERGLVQPEQPKPKPKTTTVEGRKVQLWPGPVAPEALAEPGSQIAPETISKPLETGLELKPSHIPRTETAPAHIPESWKVPKGIQAPKYALEMLRDIGIKNYRESLPVEVRELATPDIKHGAAWERVLKGIEAFEKKWPMAWNIPQIREFVGQKLQAMPEDQLSLHDKKLLLLRMADRELFQDVMELGQAPSDISFARLAMKGYVKPLAELAFPNISLLLSEEGRQALKEAGTVETAAALLGAAAEVVTTWFWGAGLIGRATGLLGRAVGVPAGIAATVGAQAGTGYGIRKLMEGIGLAPSKEEVEKAIVEGREPPQIPDWAKMPLLGLGIIGGGSMTLQAIKALLPQALKDVASHLASGPLIRQLRELNNAVHTVPGKQINWLIPRVQAEADSSASGHFKTLDPVRELNKEQRRVLPRFMDLAGEGKHEEAYEILARMKPADQLKFAEAVERVREVNMQIARDAESVGLLFKDAKGNVKPFKVEDLPEKFREGWYAPRIVNPTLWGPLKKDLAAFSHELRDILEREGYKAEDIEKNVEATLQAYQAFIRKNRPHKVTREAIDFIMKERNLTPGQALWHLAQQYVESKDEIFFSPNLQRPRTIPIRIPGLHLEDIIEVYDRYIKNSTLTIAGVKYFGPRGEVAKELLDKIDDPVERHLLSQALWRFARGHAEDERLPHWYEKIWRWYIPAQVMAKIGFGTANIANWFQPFISVFAQAGLTNAARGLYKLATDASFRDLVRSSGATVNYNVASLLAGIAQGSKLEKVAESVTKWNTFTGTNKFWQTLSAATGYLFLQDMAKMAKGKDPLHFIPKLGVKRQQFAENYLRKLGVDISKIGEDGSIPLDELKVGMYNFANRQQLQKSIAYEPAFINNPWVRPFTLFKRFGVKQWQMIYNDMLKYALINPMPVIRLGLLVPIAGETADVAKELYRSLLGWALGGRSPEEKLEDFWREKKHQSLLQRLVDDISNVGMLGIVSDWMSPRKVVGEKEPVTTPSTILAGALSAVSPIQAQTTSNIQMLLTDMARHPLWPYWPEALGKAIAKEFPLVRAAMKEVSGR